MNIDLNLLKIFIKVAESGSFTMAAAKLSQPKSSVSRGISKLEESLGVELIRRTTRRTSLTSNGVDFLKKIQPLFLNLENAINSLLEKDREMSGSIRLTASDSIGQTILSKILSEFSLRNPRVEFDVVVTNEKLDLTKENIDLAFRAGKLSDSILIQKKLLQTRFILVAAPSYIAGYGQPESIEEINEHRFLKFTPVLGSKINDFNNIFATVNSDSLSMLLTMVLKGDGVAVLPDFYCKDLIEEKKLIRIIPAWISKPETIHILYPPTKNLSKRVRELIAFSREMMQSF